MLGAFGLLLVAVATEVAATASLPRADGFRNPVWSVIVMSGYVFSIWALTVVVRHMSVSVAYAIWAGIGTALVAVVGALFLGEGWDPVKVGALALIIAGVVVLNLHGAH